MSCLIVCCVLLLCLVLICLVLSCRVSNPNLNSTPFLSTLLHTPSPIPPQDKKARSPRKKILRPVRFCLVIVLSCLVFSCFAWSCLDLSCLVLSCLVFSCFVWSYLDLSCRALSCLVLGELRLGFGKRHTDGMQARVNRTDSQFSRCLLDCTYIFDCNVIELGPILAYLASLITV